MCQIKERGKKYYFFNYATIVELDEKTWAYKNLRGKTEQKPVIALIVSL